MSVAENKALAAPGQTTAARLVALLAIAIFINYIDRGNLATAAPQIKDQLHLTNTQFGLLTSAFFWTYTPAMLLAAWLADRINPYRTLALGFALWSAATALTGLAGGYLTLFALRFCLGIGESVAFPCSSKLMSDYLPPHRFGAANGLLIAGVAWGPAFGTLAGGLMMQRYGWRAMFVVFGLAAFLWLLPWLQATRRAPPPVMHEEARHPPSFAAILSRRELWGASLGHFGSNYVLYFVLSWLPLYLVKDRGFTITEMAGIVAVIYSLYGASSILLGWLSDRWIAAGATLERVRKTVFIAGLIGIAIGLLGTALGGRDMAVASLMFCGFCFGTNGTSLWSVTQTLAGPRGSARWVGIQNAFANFAGIVGPVVTGYVVDRTGSFVDAFYLAGIMALLAAATWGLMIRKVAPIDWGTA
jgi:MFS family permease